MSISLKNSLTVDKIDTGRAPNAFSSRQQYPDNAVVPRRNPVDMYGRSAQYSTIETATSGATDPLPVIQRQNMLDRPQYGTYLNVQRGLGGGYDTMLGAGYLNRSQNHKDPQPSQRSASNYKSIGSIMTQKFN
jgi:hypothetical protein